MRKGFPLPLSTNNYATSDAFLEAKKIPNKEGIFGV